MLLQIINIIKEVFMDSIKLYPYFIKMWLVVQKINN